MICHCALTAACCLHIEFFSPLIRVKMPASARACGSAEHPLGREHENPVTFPKPV
jgi:hypothetical protein